jgi:hypothetical protein
VTRSSASATICRLILDTPEARSVKVIGTSTTRNPSCQALCTISIWKQYPLDRTASTGSSSSTSRR